MVMRNLADTAHALGWRPKWRHGRWLLVGVVMVGVCGCTAFLRDTPAPIPLHAERTSPETSATTLVVLLPGRGDSMTAFVERGLTDILREAGVSADTVTVDAHLGYYYNRTVVERLRQDVFLPARQQGYRRIVVAGVSLGGLGALLCERDRPGSVDAIVLLGPYLGDKAALFDRIAAGGGPAAWAAGRDPGAGGVAEQLWTFLGQRSAALPPTWLLAGQSDSFAPGHRLLASLLPSARVSSIAGGHDWPTWLELWREVCVQSDLFAAEKAK